MEKQPKNLTMLTARTRAKLTQQDLAKEIGSSRTWISLIENNQAPPSLSLAKKIAARLGVTVDDLFGDSDGKTQ